VSGDFIDDPDFADLYLYNNRAIDFYTGANTDMNNFIAPQNHVPRMEIGNFLEILCNTFGIGIFIGSNANIFLRYRNNVFTPRQVINITNYVEDYFEDDLTEIATGGLRLSFDFGGNDSAVDDWVKTIDKSRIRGEVNKQSDFATLVLTPAAVMGDLVYCRADNYFYVFDASNNTWNYFSEYHEPVIVGDGKDDHKAELAPLLQAVYSDGFGTNTNYDMCTCNGPGSYYSYSGTLVETEYPLRMFYIKKLSQNVGTEVPVSFANNYDIIGVKRVAYGLSFNSIDSLYKKLHKKYYDRLLNGKYYKVNLLKNYWHSLKLSFESAVQIKNVQYIIVDFEKDLGDDKSYIQLKLLPI
jgi:hypothetical protein